MIISSSQQQQNSRQINVQCAVHTFITLSFHSPYPSFFSVFLSDYSAGESKHSFSSKTAKHYKKFSAQQARNEKEDEN